MLKFRQLICIFFLLVALPCLADEAGDSAKLNAELDQQIERLTTSISQRPDDVDLCSQRGDANFFRGKFEDAVKDYDRMVALKPELATSHWRRGIALFYAARYDDAARQFEQYHSFDNVDRENGIWRYFSQFKAAGAERARAELLKYEKDDREPFPDVYRLFAGEVTPAQILKNIAAAEISDTEREKRLFYSHLYIGLHHAIAGRKAEALPQLESAVANKWGRGAGYGPNYMWHVGRLHLEILQQPEK